MTREPWFVAPWAAFAWRWLIQTIREWIYCPAGHEWDYDGDTGAAWCEVCGMPGEVAR